MKEIVESVISLLPYMVEPTITAIKLFFLTLLFGLPLGMILALGRMSKLAIIRYPIQFYNLVMRGTPLILQLYLIYYQIPKWIQMYHPDFRFDRFTAVVVGFSLNYGAYFCEIKDKLTKEIKDRKEAFALLDGLERLFRDCLLGGSTGSLRKEQIIRNIAYVEAARRDLLANVNYKYAIRNLVLKIGG